LPANCLVKKQDWDSSMRNKLLIIHKQQFGYHSDTYYYCKYLSTLFDITYICWHYSRKEILLPGIKVIYISREGNLASRNLRYIWQVLLEIKKNYHFHIIKYFKGCSLIKLLHPKPNFLLDIRSNSVRDKKVKRVMNDLLMKTETKFFTHISVISKSLSQKLKLPKKVIILPLGADILSATKKTFTTMNLFYVGSLHNRNIDQTIKGFSKFYHEFKDKISISYTIVGGGLTTEEEGLKKQVQQERIAMAVKIVGPVPHDELRPFFDGHNIGVSYIPKTDYYDVQPPTKTFEYLLSGMPVIATDTLENKLVINNQNGILISDTSEDFYNGLVRFYENRTRYNSHEIRFNSTQFTWEKIVADLNLTLQGLINNNETSNG
jgi:glycosyltransferase involved in cell wall biosynthesis